LSIPISRPRAAALLVRPCRRVSGELLTAASGASASGAVANDADKSKPTTVLVRGAFADSSSWNGVVARVRHYGYSVIAAANPPRVFRLR
jgi:hypothetical protein